jgi:hypothetical protein
MADTITYEMIIRRYQEPSFVIDTMDQPLSWFG